MEIKEIMELMKAVSDNALTSFELEQGDMKLSMKREKKVVSQLMPVAAGIPAQMTMPAIQAAELPGVERPIQTMEDANGTGTENPGNEAGPGVVSADQIVTCPLVGTFYSSPSPEAEDFVRVGDPVKKGQVIGIVEAMKLMNEIECEYDGVVDAILVKNEEVVEFGQPLFRIR